MRKPRRSCFVVMPYGERKVAGVREKVDFDRLYRRFLKPLLKTKMGLDCNRCDELHLSGSIHPEMFSQIRSADVVVVDVSANNPNVFYELGVRHALRESITVLIRQDGTKLPFNINGVSVIDYVHDDAASKAQAAREIQNVIETGLKLGKIDSPIHQFVDLADDEPPLVSERVEYLLTSFPEKRIGLIGGDIRDVRNVDVWVNSENTNMQMARFYERSISAVIRHLGAKKDETGEIVGDTIGKALAQRMGRRQFVAPSTVLTTTAGELETTHGVKRILHVASVVGVVGSGYAPVDTALGACVRRCLERLDEPDLRRIGARSILLPLMGTGTARGDVRRNARMLIRAAANHLVAFPDCAVEAVYFLALRRREFDVCSGILNVLPGLMREDADRSGVDARRSRRRKS